MGSLRNLKLFIFIAIFLVLGFSIIGLVFLTLNRNSSLNAQAYNPQNQLFEFNKFKNIPLTYGTSYPAAGILRLSAFLVEKKTDSNNQIVLTIFIPQDKVLGQMIKVVYPPSSTNYFTVLKNNKFGEDQAFRSTSNTDLFSKLITSRQIMFNIKDINGGVATKINSGNSNPIKLILNFINPPVKINSDIISIYFGDK